jgi:disulfide bond formation protein DsbB
MSTVNNTYIPGVCNIGPAEIKRRQQSGYIGLIIAIVLWVVLAALHGPAVIRLVVFLPAAMSASGFIQAYKHFCAGFGMKGVFNFDATVGQTDTVAQKEFRAADRQEARKILGLSVLCGLIVALIAYIA